MLELDLVTLAGRLHSMTAISPVGKFDYSRIVHIFSAAALKAGWWGVGTPNPLSLGNRATRQLKRSF